MRVTTAQALPLLILRTVSTRTFERVVVIYWIGHRDPRV